MNYWILKANPRYNKPFKQWILPGASDKWGADRTPPKDFREGNKVVFWQSGTRQRVIALGFVEDPTLKTNAEGRRHFRVCFTTGVVDETWDLVALRKLSLFKNAGFLKSGPTATIYRLSAEQGEFLYRQTSSGERDVSDWEQINMDLAVRVSRSMRDSVAKRKKRMAKAAKVPAKRAVVVYVYERNADVIAEALSKADGTCGCCHKPAPFKRASDKTPYLEVHHKLPLANGGQDTVENAIALCPNCHRNEHHGSPKLRRRKAQQ